MKSYLIKVTFFIFPVFLSILFPAAVIWYGKEYISSQQAVAFQEKNQKALFGFAYNGASFYPYKRILVEEKKPKIIALGTSRVMQFRREFFNASTTFVNAGGAGRSLQDIETFISSLPGDSSTKIIILGLDKEVLANTYESKEVKEEESAIVRFGKIVISMSRRIYLDYGNHKFSFNKLVSTSKTSDNIGLSALLHGDGFRSDGSYRYGGVMSNPYRISEIHTQVDSFVSQSANRPNYTFSTNSDIQHIKANEEALSRILRIAQERGIIVIGIMPPYPDPVYKILTQGSSSLRFASEETSKVFKSKNFPFFDFSSAKILGSKETEFFDSVHGTDLMYMRILVYIQEHTNLFTNYSDVASLRILIKKTDGDFLPF